MKTSLVTVASLLLFVSCTNGLEDDVMVEADDVMAEDDVMEARGAIVNGDVAPDRPFYVRLYLNKGNRRSLCGGSIISQTLILTAAHCIGNNGNEIEVQVGSFNRGNVRYTSYYGRGYMHPKYRGIGQYDVAVVELGDRLDSRRVIEVCGSQPRQMVVCGMGQTGYNEGPSDFLLELEIRQKSCRNWKASERINVCGVGKYKNSDSCMGDSGGPLFGVGRGGRATCVYAVVSGGDKYCLKGGMYAKAELVWDMLE